MEAESNQSTFAVENARKFCLFDEKKNKNKNSSKSNRRNNDEKNNETKKKTRTIRTTRPTTRTALATPDLTGIYKSILSAAVVSGFRKRIEERTDQIPGFFDRIFNDHV
ncbi:MAG: hypothetical protein O7D30_03615, partial [Rickettsia endosymbiont of Ixodes persulcatus]|nr:hypothetical protein [Rickettsia endosymbiont of Ixodes persulcatus]